MFKKTKKLNLKILAMSLGFLFNFSNVNAMQNLKNPQSNNINLTSIVKNFSSSKNQLKEIKEMIKKIKEFKRYIQNKNISKEEIQDEKTFEELKTRFINMKGKQYRNKYNMYYIYGTLDDIGKNYMYENFANLNTFAEKIKDLKTLKEYLTENLIHLDDDGKMEKNIIEKCEEILENVEENKDDNIDEIKAKVSRKFNKYMSECENLNIDIVDLLQWFAN